MTAFTDTERLSGQRNGAEECLPLGNHQVWCARELNAVPSEWSALGRGQKRRATALARKSRASVRKRRRHSPLHPPELCRRTPKSSGGCGVPLSVPGVQSPAFRSGNSLPRVAKGEGNGRKPPPLVHLHEAEEPVRGGGDVLVQVENRVRSQDGVSQVAPSRSTKIVAILDLIVFAGIRRTGEAQLVS